jgi:hypothetical protein
MIWKLIDTNVLKINIPSLIRGRRTNDTIVSAVVYNILFFLNFVKFCQSQEVLLWIE